MTLNGLEILKNWEAEGFIEIEGSSWWWTDRGLYNVSQLSRDGLRRALRGQHVEPKILIAMKREGFTKDGYYDRREETVPN